MKIDSFLFIGGITMNQDRIITIKEPISSKRVLYIMYNAFRLGYNHAITYAKTFQESELSIYLLRFLEENPRNNDYFEKGIGNYKEALGSTFTKTALFYDKIEEKHFIEYDHIILDMAYLKHEKTFVKQLKTIISDREIGLEMVESNVLIPVTIASNKEEYSAKTIRPKILSKIESYLDLYEDTSNLFTYEEKALEVLNEFIDRKLNKYDQSNHPEYDYTSSLSPFLKFGFISPLRIYRQLEHVSSAQKDSYIEQLIVRRELAYNFIYYNENYDQFDSITYSWAYQTMEEHQVDERPHLYDMNDYKTFSTHDPYFNAAMKDMVYFGSMHNYMRMYWAKKIIEWSRTYKEAYDIISTLNNYYFLDGNSPNGFTGVAWCFGKHDRAWASRPIFGKLRYMNSNGLRRKFDIDLYVQKINKKVADLNEGIS